MPKTPQIRSTLRHLLRTSENDATTETWNLINEGVTELTEEFNPDSDTIQYVAEENKTTFIKSYAPSLTLTMSIVQDDPVNEYIRKRINELPLGANADTAYIRFNLMDKVTGTGSSESYTAYKRYANLSVSSIGGSAEDYLGAEVTISGKGDQTKGTVTYNSSDKTWTFTPDTTV